MDDALRNYYENEGLEDLRIQEDGIQYTEFLTLTKYFDKVFKSNATILDPCAGTGVYSFYLADRGHTVVAGDLLKINIDVLKMKEKERKANPLQKIYLGDIRDLSKFESESFDGVLCMGALYHMPESENRKSAIKECLRILKPGGIFVATYINRLAAILGNLTGDLTDLDEMIAFLKHGREGVFYTQTPKEIDEMMAEFPLKEIYHIGADGIGYLLCGEPPIITYEGLKKWRKLHFATCEVREILGYSYHGAYFAEKIK